MVCDQVDDFFVILFYFTFFVVYLFGVLEGSGYEDIYI